MKILIIGYGITGKALYDYFKKYQHEVYIYDEKKLKIKNYYSYAKLEKDLPLFDLGIKSPGIRFNNEKFLLIKSLCLKIMSELDFAFSKMEKCYVIGITGSNGKTSLATYLNHFISKKKTTYLAGNIGKPLISLVDQIKKNDVVILELSSFQIQDCENIYLDELFYTSLSPNHLNVYHYLKSYYADKKRALFFIKSNKIYCLNNSKKIIGYPSFSIKKDFTKQIKKYLIGRYSIEYCNIAMNYCLNLGFIDEELLLNLKLLKPVEYRLNYLGQYHNLFFINDGKSSTSSSSKYCFDSFKNKKRILILGGNHKSSSFNVIKVTKNDEILIYGHDKNIINQQLPGKLFSTLEDIFLYLKDIKDKRYILFSPGCDSHDQYSSYLERGKHFNQLVEKYFGDKHE